MTNFAVLAMGGLTSMVRLSLDSIIQLKDVTLHVMTEEHYFSSFSSYAEQSGIQIHLFNASLPHASMISEANYEVYGTDRFAQINLLKWQLVTESLERMTSGDVLFFSDFDVLWFRNPSKIFEDRDYKFIVAQSEWKKVDGVKYCSGIIGIVKNPKTTDIFLDLFEFHRERLSSFKGKYFDQQAFNDYFSKNVLENEVESLPYDSFIIGAEIPKYILKSKTKVYAVHVNYLKGLDRKVFVMRTVKLCFERRKLRFAAAALIKLLLIEGRLASNSEKVRARFTRKRGGISGIF
jgi:hypothetical protein